MLIEELIEEKMKPQSFDWWGKHYTDIVPALVDAPLGDGQALMGFSSLDTRPRHWLIRVDSSVSSMNEDELSDYVEEHVIAAIANCFGECDHDDRCDCAWPTLILETGYNWWICHGKGADYD